MQNVVELSLDFLLKWNPEGPWSLTSITLQKKLETTTFTKAQVEEMGAWITAQNTAQKNLYFSVNSLTKKIYKKASRTDIKSMDWLHVDVDPRPGEDIQDEQERALRMLQNPKEGIERPTVILFSGGGYQGFWRLDEPVQIDGEQGRYEEAALYNKHLEVVFGADHCHNVDRIMRLPGTVNWPDAKKQAKGRKPALAKVIEWHDHSYKLSQFVKSQPKQAEADGFDSNVEVSGNVRRFATVDELDTLLPDNGKKLSDRCKVVIVQGTTADHDELDFPSRSEALFFVCCEMVRAGFDNDAIYSVITDPDFAISESVVEKKSSAERYAKKQIRSARERAIDPLLQEMNEKHAVIGDVGGKCRVISEYPDPITGRPSFSKQAFEDVRNRYCNQLVKAGENKDGELKYEPLGAWWIKHKDRRFFDRMVFAPSQTIPGVYNMWRGFTVDPKPGNCKKYLRHARDNICKGDESLYQYLINWMARAVQFPGEPGFTAVVLRGEMGTGKSFFVRQFGELFGTHCLVVSDAKFLVGSFNAHLEDCVVLFGDEAFYAGDHKHESVLKNLITSETLTIEEKGLNMRKSHSCLHIMMASNSEWVVPAGLKERRFFVLDVSKDQMQNTKYFADIKEELDNGGYEALLHHLLTVDLTGWNYRIIPQTEGLKNQQMQSLTTEQEWWYCKLQDGTVLTSDNKWRADVPCRDLINDYLRFCKRNNIHRSLTASRLSQFLGKVIPDLKRVQIRGSIEIEDLDGKVITLTRPYYYKLPSLAALREHWDTNYANLGKWEADTIGEEPTF